MKSKKRKIPAGADFNCDGQTFANSVCIHKIIRDLATNNGDEETAKLHLIFKTIFTELSSVNAADKSTLSALEFMVNDFVDNINGQSEMEKKLLDDFNRFVDQFGDEFGEDDDDYLIDIY